MRSSAQDVLRYLRDLRPISLDVDLKGGYVIYRESRLAFDTTQIESHSRGETNDQGDRRWGIADVLRLRYADWDLEVLAEALPQGDFRAQTFVRVHNTPRIRVVDHHHKVDAFNKADFTARLIAERGETPMPALLKGPSTYMAELHVQLMKFFAHGTEQQRLRAKSALQKLPVLHR